MTPYRTTYTHTFANLVVRTHTQAHTLFFEHHHTDAYPLPHSAAFSVWVKGHGKVAFHRLCSSEKRREKGFVSLILWTGGLTRMGQTILLNKQITILLWLLLCDYTPLRARRYCIQRQNTRLHVALRHKIIVLCYTISFFVSL